MDGKKFLNVLAVRDAKIRKVKEISPSPFYDGKYHPPIFL